MAYLAEQWPGHEVSQDGGEIAVVLPEFNLPDGFEPRVVDLLLRLPFGFPETQPDMFWVDPHVTLHGAQPEACTEVGAYLGRSWMRFSRHLPDGVWRPGIDDLRAYMSLIIKRLADEAGTAA